MKIITWNVNGIRAVERKGALQELEETQKSELLLLQEIKGNRDQFSAYLTEHPNYEQYYHSAQKKGYAGTGIWIYKDFLATCRNVAFHTNVPHAPNADEGRVAHLSFIPKGKHIVYDVISIYFPNGGKSADAWTQKLVFFDKVLAYMNHLRKEGHIVIIGGDMNVAHTEIDLARPTANDGKIGFHPDERAWMDRVIADGWIDVWRNQNPDVTDVYSWWDMITRARDRNVGWRIDYFFAGKEKFASISDVSYLHKQMGSDHCPLMMDIAL